MIWDAFCVERARFDRKSTHTTLFLHRAKTSHPVYATLRNEIADEVFALANPDGRYLFVDSVPQNERGLDLLVKWWGDLFRKLGLLADLRDGHGQSLHFASHSMRHTFVFWALNAGLKLQKRRQCRVTLPRGRDYATSFCGSRRMLSASRSRRTLLVDFPGCPRSLPFSRRAAFRTGVFCVKV
jgi:hypothetical protein